MPGSATAPVVTKVTIQLIKAFKKLKDELPAAQAPVAAVPPPIAAAQTASRSAPASAAGTAAAPAALPTPAPTAAAPLDPQELIRDLVSKDLTNTLVNDLKFTSTEASELVETLRDDLNTDIGSYLAPTATHAQAAGSTAAADTGAGVGTSPATVTSSSIGPAPSTEDEKLQALLKNVDTVFLQKANAMLKSKLKKSEDTLLTEQKRLRDIAENSPHTTELKKKYQQTIDDLDGVTKAEVTLDSPEANNLEALKQCAAKLVLTDEQAKQQKTDQKSSAENFEEAKSALRKPFDISANIADLPILSHDAIDKQRKAINEAIQTKIDPINSELKTAQAQSPPDQQKISEITKRLAFAPVAKLKEEAEKINKTVIEKSAAYKKQSDLHNVNVAKLEKAVDIFRKAENTRATAIENAHKLLPGLINAIPRKRAITAADKAFKEALTTGNFERLHTEAKIAVATTQKDYNTALTQLNESLARRVALQSLINDQLTPEFQKKVKEKDADATAQAEMYAAALNELHNMPPINENEAKLRQTSTDILNSLNQNVLNEDNRPIGGQKQEAGKLFNKVKVEMLKKGDFHELNGEKVTVTNEKGMQIIKLPIPKEATAADQKLLAKNIINFILHDCNEIRSMIQTPWLGRLTNVHDDNSIEFKMKDGVSAQTFGDNVQDKILDMFDFFLNRADPNAELTKEELEGLDKTEKAKVDYLAKDIEGADNARLAFNGLSAETRESYRKQIAAKKESAASALNTLKKATEETEGATGAATNRPNPFSTAITRG